jgi:predicted transcriptional regulator
MAISTIQYRTLACVKNYKPVQGTHPRSTDLCRILMGASPQVMLVRMRALQAAGLVERDEARRWRITAAGLAALDRWVAEVRGIVEEVDRATEVA